MLVAEFALTENPANTTTSQLRVVCHADDSVILGTWLQETDHKTIEDQVEEIDRILFLHLNKFFYCCFLFFLHICFQSVLIKDFMENVLFS